MNDDRDFDVLVVGGGTAGWLTATMLNFALRAGDGGPMRIALCESPAVPTIGVGESTLPTLAHTLAAVGLDETAWMPVVGASYKMGVRFLDWCAPGSRACRADFWNPVEQLADRAAVDRWFANRDVLDFADECCITPPLAAASRAPKRLDGTRLNEYAYHVDAIRLADVLQRTAVARGVRHISDHVTGVSCGEGARIDAVHTRKSGSLTASLVVDCTGFRSVLLGEALGEPFLSFGESLLTDRAIAIPTPYADDAPATVASYTSAVAMSSGWMWCVPLTTREGIGYVYSSHFQSPEDAERELRDRVCARADAVEARHLTMRVGRRARSWVGNCVAVGLSSGFVEPLEATGIYLIERGVIALLKALRKGGADVYNEEIGAAYEEVRDLIVMHYLVNDRTHTPFWAATKRVDVPETLQRRLEVWKHRPPERDDFPSSSVFGVTTWLAVLAGMGFWRDVPVTPRRPVGATALTSNTSSLIADLRRHLLGEAADHRRLLEAMASTSG